MPDLRNEVVEDRTNALAGKDHMGDMTRVQLTVLKIDHPFPTIARLTVRIHTEDPAAWSVPNVAVRLEVAEVEGHRPISRIYTIRRFDPETCEAEIDFVLHEGDSPAMLWLRAARPGTTALMIGPRPHFSPAFEAGKRIAILADETAIPAVLSILDAWPEGEPAEAWIETADRAAFDELPRPRGVTLHHLPRAAQAPAGTTGALAAAARAAITDGNWTVWAAGERRDMREIRAVCAEHGIGREGQQIMGYWKLGMSSSEIDRHRLATYEALKARGVGLDNLSDADLDI